MPITVVEPLAKILRVSPYYLMGWEDNTPELINGTLGRIIHVCSSLNSQGQERVLEYSTDLKESGNYERTALYTVGSVAAGSGFVYADPVEYYRIFMTPDIPDHDFSVDVKGNSMFPTICDGETVFVVKDYEKIDKDIYVLDVDGETVVKRVLFADNTIILLSDNEAYDDRVLTGYKLEQTRVLGRVVGWEMPVD